MNITKQKVILFTLELIDTLLKQFTGFMYNITNTIWAI